MIRGPPGSPRTNTLVPYTTLVRAMAREQLDVTTIVFNNSSYAVLNRELARVGATAEGDKARDMLDLRRPDLDFVSLATGMGVSATRATTSEEFVDQLTAALATPGPTVIEALIPSIMQGFGPEPEVRLGGGVTRRGSAGAGRQGRTPEPHPGGGEGG